MDWKLVLLLALLLVAYLSAGAYLFQHLEGQQNMEGADNLGEGEEKRNMTVAPPELPDNFTQALLAHYPALREDELAELVHMVVTAYTDGTLPANTSTKATTTGVNWDISTGFFFVGTVVTTIGYGNVVPVTVQGRVATIFYGLIGIPLCLIFLAALGEKLLWCFKRIERLCGHLCIRCEKTCHVMRVFTLVIVGWGLFLMIPAIIFSHMEGWEYVESVYFCFVTLSTIGFGDLVTNAQAANNKALYRVLTVMWVYVGLAWLSSLIALISDILQKTIDERGNQVQKQITHGVHNIARHVSAKVHHHDPEDPDKQNGTKYHIKQTNTHTEVPEGGEAQEDQGAQTNVDKPARQSLTEGHISIL